MQKMDKHPNIIHLHPDDQVVVAFRDLSKGEKVLDVTLTEDIMHWHKVAIKPIPAKSPVLKYGEEIGYATQDIAPGQWVHSHNLATGKVLELEDHELATAVPPDPEPITDRYFLGYRSPEGRAATRNYILLASTVDCANHALDMALRELNRDRDALLRRYPNVDGILGLTHESGCGLASGSEGHQRQNRTINGFLTHPNAAACLVVGLGCEKSRPELIYGSDPLAKEGSPKRKTPLTYMIQDEGGTQAAVDKIVAFVQEQLPLINRRRRELIPASELIMATQCGGSNGLSGITSNPAIGVASDMLVACGGASFLAELTETVGAGHLLTRRAKTVEIAKKYLAIVAWWQQYLDKHGASFEDNTTPGNRRGGLTTVAEKALGSSVKSGTAALSGVIEYAEPIPGPGLYFMNSPGYDPASTTGQTASGALVGVFSTGQGSCFGGMLIPWIKVVSNSEVYERLPDMEINAGALVEGVPLETIGRQIFEQVLATASGAKTYSEKMNITVFNVWNTGVTT